MKSNIRNHHTVTSTNPVFSFVALGLHPEADDEDWLDKNLSVLMGEMKRKPGQEEEQQGLTLHGRRLIRFLLDPLSCAFFGGFLTSSCAFSLHVSFYMVWRSGVEPRYN